jgi:hypothetical protein
LHRDNLLITIPFLFLSTVVGPIVNGYFALATECKLLAGPNSKTIIYRESTFPSTNDLCFFSFFLLAFDDDGCPHTLEQYGQLEIAFELSNCQAHPSWGWATRVRSNAIQTSIPDNTDRCSRPFLLTFFPQSGVPGKWALSIQGQPLLISLPFLQPNVSLGADTAYSTSSTTMAESRIPWPTPLSVMPRTQDHLFPQMLTLFRFDYWLLGCPRWPCQPSFGKRH